MADSNTPALDKDLLATLSPEERAAISGADPDELASLKSIAGGSADVKADAEDDADDEADEADDDAADAGADEKAAAAADAPAAAPAPAPAPAQDDAPPAAAAQAATDEVPDEIPAPRVKVFELPEDFEARVASNKAAIDGVYERLRSGEIAVDDLPTELNKLQDEQRELDRLRMRAETSRDRLDEAMGQWREQTIARVFDRAAKPEGGGIDYRKDAGAMKDIDLFVKALASDPANENKSLTWFLQEGHRRVMALRGATAAPAPAPAPAPAQAAAPAAKQAASRKAPIEDVPRSLADVPGGDGPGDVGGEFDNVLELEGEAFERAINEMAKRDPARFARFQQSRG